MSLEVADTGVVFVEEDVAPEVEVAVDGVFADVPPDVEAEDDAVVDLVEDVEIGLMEEAVVEVFVVRVDAFVVKAVVLVLVADELALEVATDEASGNIGLAEDDSEAGVNGIVALEEDVLDAGVVVIGDLDEDDNDDNAGLAGIEDEDDDNAGLT